MSLVMLVMILLCKRKQKVSKYQLLETFTILNEMFILFIQSNIKQFCKFVFFAFVADAAYLHLDPNRAQFFEYESVTFYCEGVFGYEVVHESKGKIPTCNITGKGESTGSSCTIKNVYAADSGRYWCHTGGVKRSNSVNINVTGKFLLSQHYVSDAT